jgi:hypothetical protein
VSKTAFPQLALTLLLALVPAMAAKPAASAAAKPAASGKRVDPATLPLDYAAVKSYYNDGDFGPAIDILEEFQRTHTTFAREESLTVYKYLGVMYCADQVTREKGKSYFYKLLKIDPEARILDMYVSIVVQDIFKSTLDELMNAPGTPRDRTAVQGGKPPAKGETFPVPRPGGPSKESQVAEKKGNAGLWWAAGGLAVAAGIAGGYYFYASNADPEKGPDQTILVDPDGN